MCSVLLLLVSGVEDQPPQKLESEKPLSFHNGSTEKKRFFFKESLIVQMKKIREFILCNQQTPSLTEYLKTWRTINNGLQQLHCRCLLSLILWLIYVKFSRTWSIKGISYFFKRYEYWSADLFSKKPSFLIMDLQDLFRRRYGFITVILKNGSVTDL